MKTIFDYRNEQLAKIESDPQILISKNVLIALDVLTEEEYEQTIKAIFSLKDDNWQESPTIKKLHKSSQDLYAKIVNSSIIILFSVEENGMINITNLMRKERIKLIYEQLHQNDKVSEIWRRIFTTDN